MDFFFPDGFGIFQQDNAKIHQALVVKEWRMRTHECERAWEVIFTHEVSCPGPCAAPVSASCPASLEDWQAPEGSSIYHTLPIKIDWWPCVIDEHYVHMIDRSVWLTQDGLADIMLRLSEDGLADILLWLSEDGLADILLWLSEDGLVDILLWLSRLSLYVLWRSRSVLVWILLCFFSFLPMVSFFPCSGVKLFTNSTSKLLLFFPYVFFSVFFFFGLFIFEFVQKHVILPFNFPQLFPQLLILSYPLAWHGHFRALEILRGPHTWRTVGGMWGDRRQWRAAVGWCHSILIYWCLQRWRGQVHDGVRILISQSVSFLSLSNLIR